MKTKAWEQDFNQDLAPADRHLTAFAEAVRAEAERPEGFWRAQRSAIAGRIQDSQRRASLRLAWAGSLALVVIAASLLTQAPAPVASAAQNDPDHDLLVGVERAVRRPVPQALEPARLLAQEIERSATAESKGNPK